jgi:rhodanese-related sulfurtransferase
VVTLFAAILQIFVLTCFAQAPEPAPILNIDGVDGHQLVIRPALLQKPLLVHFFSLQDSHWQEELLRLKSFNERFEKEGLALISIAEPVPKAREILADFAVKNHIQFPIAVDSGNLSAVSGEKVPHVVLISPDAEIVLRLYESPSSAQLQDIGLRLPALIARRKELLELAAARASSQKTIEEAATHVAVISPEELKARLGTSLHLFFIGGKKIFDEKHIHGASRLDYGEVDDFFKDKDKAEEWIFYCDCTQSVLGRSGRVAAELYLKGFKRTVYLKGQLQEWEKRGYPLERGSSR